MESLPVYAHKKEILHAIKTHDHSVIISSTGSGKTTVIPQVLLKDNQFNQLCIGVTQPRRIAAISVATYVAEFNGEVIGSGSIGYSVRFDDKCCSKTVLKYMTDGILIRESLSDPLLRRYGVVIVDEAHERRINSDVTLGILKSAVERRKVENISPLKIIIMSATINPVTFVNFFGGPAHVKTIFIEGRQFPVKVFTGKQISSNFIQDAVYTCLRIHKSESNTKKAILVFLPGEREIYTFINQLQSLLKIMKKTNEVYIKANLCPLYSSLPKKDQLKAIKPSMDSVRKIIAATNIAETSLTLADVTYVIDCGYQKIPVYNPFNGVESLVTKKISQYQAWQRCGRAGRQGPGVCIRIYTQEDFENRPENIEPEISAAPMQDVLLYLLEIGVQNLMKFPWITQPNVERICSGMKMLKKIEAVQDDGDNLRLTEKGKLMTAIPLTAKLAAALLLSYELKCLADMLNIVSMLHVSPVFYGDDIYNDHESNQDLFHPDGDIFSLLAIFKKYKQMKRDSPINERKQWCDSHNINKSKLDEAMRVRTQLRNIVLSIFDIEKLPMNKESPEAIIKCLIQSSYRDNIAKVRPLDEWETNNTPTYFNSLIPEHKLTIHHTSCLYKSKISYEYLLYLEAVESPLTTAIQLRHCAVVDPNWV